MDIHDLPPTTPTIAVVVGTRPEIIKLAPVIRELGPAATVIHTGQHFDDALAGDLFAELGIGTPDVVLDGIGGVARTRQVGRMILALGELFDTLRPGAVIVQGDTNTVSAAAQAANYAGIPVIHVEAGLRSNDRGMPEEINRLVVAALADVHCVPTARSRDLLLREQIAAESIALTGNTIVEATERALATARAPKRRHDFVLATIHRPENTDTRRALIRVLDGLARIDAPVTLVAHPRTLSAIERFSLSPMLAGLTVIPPVGHRELLEMAASARLIVSDSGGLQEECTVVKTPLLVVRRSTERPESVDAGFSELAGPDADIARLANRMLRDEDAVDRLRRQGSPFGDGHASARIAQIARAVAAGHAPRHAIRSLKSFTGADRSARSA